MKSQAVASCYLKVRSSSQYSVVSTELVPLCDLHQESKSKINYYYFQAFLYQSNNCTLELTRTRDFVGNMDKAVTVRGALFNQASLCIAYFGPQVLDRCNERVSVSTIHGYLILRLVPHNTYHHACIPRRVRQRCINVYPQFAGMFKFHVIGVEPITINRAQILTPSCY